MNRRFDDALIWKIIKAWPLILGLIAVLIAFVTMQNTLDAHTNILNESKADRSDLRQRITRVESAIEILPEMRADIKTLLRQNKERQ